MDGSQLWRLALTWFELIQSMTWVSPAQPHMLYLCYLFSLLARLIMPMQ